jgi:adenine-specific DNA-methyltransferase
VPIVNFYDFSANFGNCRTEGGVDFRSGKKPEALIELILNRFSKPGDLILDSFAGSGTTGATAHKMNRRWIMIELGEQADTHIVPRLKRVTSGEDNTGISKGQKWTGGGGFKYFKLGESLFVEDDELRLTVVNPKMYNGPLIRAVLKIEGFKLLNPDNALHGIAGRTVAHVTEQYINQSYVDVLLGEVGKQADFIVIYAKTISSKLNLPDNIEIRRMPEVLLRKFKV